MTTATSVIRRLATLTAALLLVCAWSTRTRAAVALDAVTTNVGTGTSVTIPHTTGIAADRVMLVGVSLYNSSKAVTSCTYGGTALTRLGFLDGGSGSNDRRVEMWMLVNPPAGTNNVVVSFASSAKAVVGVATLFGVDQTTPSGPFVSNEANTNVATLTVPSAAGEMVIDCMSVAGNAATATVGPGQTSLWNDFSRNNGGAVVGTASAEAGAPSVAMTWNLSAVEYWVLGAVSLKPAIRPYQPDLMVKLSGEANTAYFYNYFYENPAVLQVKAASMLAASTASYNVRIENDGLSPDRFLLAGTAPTSAFAVQYLDETGTDRTAAVAGGGYTTALLAPGAGVVWTLNVTPQPAGNAGGLTFAASLTGTSQGDGTKSDQVLTQTTCVSPNLVMSKSVDLANALPGQDIHYTMVANSTGLSDASGIVLVDSIPAYAGFQIGSATFNSGTTSLTSSVSYSNDHGLTWGYTPGTGSCTAPSGYDYCVTHVRWTLAGTMPPSQNFTVGMTVRVK